MNQQIFNNSSPKAKAMRLRILRAMAGCFDIKTYLTSPITYRTYGSWETAETKNGLSTKGAILVLECAKSHGVYTSLDWLMQGIGPWPEYIAPKKTAPSYLSIAFDEDIKSFRQNNPNNLDLIVPDTSMAPFYNPGDFVGGNKVKNLKHALGQVCIVQLESGELTIRQLEASEIMGKLTLSSNNHKQQTKIVAAAPISFIRRLPLELRDNSKNS